MVLQYYKENSSVSDLKYATEQSACFDLSAHLKNVEFVEALYAINGKYNLAVQDDSITILPRERVKIPTGIILNIPENYCVKIYPRSSVAYKMGLTLANGTGIIDSDYVHPLYLLMVNINMNTPVVVKHGDRLCQAELMPIYQVQFEQISEPPLQKTSRNGGIGSTGAQ